MPDQAPTERPFGVFISYRRTDGGGYARNIYDALVEHFGKQQVFYDIDSIAPGRDFVALLEESMAQANVLLVVIGPTWTSCADDEGRRRIENPHDYVRLEVEAGLTNANVSVIPVLVGGTKMPSERSLPPALVPLARRNSLQLYDELWRPSLENLVEQLKRVRDETSASSGSGDASFFGELSAEAKVLGRQRWDTGQVEYDEDAITRDYEQPASFEERSSARDRLLDTEKSRRDARDARIAAVEAQQFDRAGEMREEELYWLRQLDRYAEALERVARRLQTKGAGRYADASHDASLWRGMAAQARAEAREHEHEHADDEG